MSRPHCEAQWPPLRCRWQPTRDSRWLCGTGKGARRKPRQEPCGYSWNTFDTRGLCPACGYQWIETKCLACHLWSRHDDWYEAGPD